MPLCAGTGALLDGADGQRVDGNGAATCPVCHTIGSIW